ncbi:MAG TPA: MBL fold metallo-hydrolase [Elusimicrobia bacterium]|nr:MBL fold metallo-hydrolase [Elusimicrobiota bacterium]
MRFVIHRGAKEIGGSCVEVQSGKSRILIDLGLPLVDPKDSSKKLEVNLRRESPARLRERGILPPIRGVWKDLHDGPAVDAILLSHPHQDHHGLLSLVRPDIPVYLSADALRILRRSDAFIKPGANIHNAQFLNHRRAKIVERTPFVVTPFAMDHSAFGALAFVVEADGKRLFYSGDFRGHGRKAALFEELCSKPPRAIDRLLIEGTTLGSASHEERTEEKLEEDLKALYSRYSGLKLVSVSGQNVDRMVTLYKSCKDSGRTFVLDLYTATILEGTKRSSIPHPGPDWHDKRALRVIYTPKYEDILRQHPAYHEVLELAEPFRIEKDEIAKDPGRHVMVFRDSLLDDYTALGDWGKGVLIYSQWSGYRKDPGFAKVDAVLKRRGMDIKPCHTSGHASKAQLKRLVQALKPKILSPMHTFHAELARELWRNVELLEDGRSYEVWGGKMR